jgi:tetratricopeptide (TPR) repeat protein
LDVYGYPISPHTSAGSELNLQEAMYGGIPPVVFPYANLKWIVEHEQTGLVVHSELEYKQAIEYLYHHPQERARLGRNAHDYAKTRFGAENTARELHAIYQRLLELPKRKRQWIPPEIIKLSANVKVQSGAEWFLQALGDTIPQFFVSMRSQNLTEIMKAERQIAELPLTISNMVGGIPSYRNAYPQDPYLRLWNGLVMQHQGKHQEATIEFLEAINLGLIHWRVYWYLAQSAIESGKKKIAESALSQVIEMEPEFIPAVTLFNRLSTGEIPMPSRVQLIIRKVKEKFL